MVARAPLRLARAVALAAALGAASAASAQTGLDARVLTRMAELEAELRRLTARVEELDAQLRRQEGEATARLEELDFRVITLEGGDPTEAFRSDEAPPAEPPAPEPAGPGAPPTALGELRVEEGASPDFSAAMRDLRSLGPDAGARSVAAFVQAAPEDPRAGEAFHALGRAYLGNGRGEEAARAFLTGLREHGDVSHGAENMLGLGEALLTLGRAADACGAFQELPRRFPQAPQPVRDAAATEAFRAGCS